MYIHLFGTLYSSGSEMSDVKLRVFNGPNSPFSSMVIQSEAFTIEENEIFAKILYSSICGSDLHTIEGRRVEPTPRYDSQFVSVLTFFS